MDFQEGRRMKRCKIVKSFLSFSCFFMYLKIDYYKDFETKVYTAIFTEMSKGIKKLFFSFYLFCCLKPKLQSV